MRGGWEADGALKKRVNVQSARSNNNNHDSDDDDNNNNGRLCGREERQTGVSGSG